MSWLLTRMLARNYFIIELFEKRIASVVKDGYLEVVPRHFPIVYYIPSFFYRKKDAWLLPKSTESMTFSLAFTFFIYRATAANDDFPLYW